MRSFLSYKLVYRSLLTLLVLVPAAFASAPTSAENVIIERESGLGVIRGVVRDQAGSPIAAASVAIFRSGTTRLLKQVESASDGSFLAKIIPGTYTVLAVAQGFNPVTLYGVQVTRSAELAYGFNLERAGSGNTLPEKRSDKNSSKWRIRAAQMQRSIYQNREGNSTVVELDPAELDNAVAEKSRKGETVVETYFSGTSSGNYAGINAASLIPISEKAELVFAGQTGVGPGAPQGVQVGMRFRPTNSHQLRIRSSAAKIGVLSDANGDRQLGQMSFQAFDEWKIREGIIFVFGVDYTSFLGASDDSFIAPRLGLQFDLNAKTRVRTAFTSQTEDRTWAHALELEGESIRFSDPVAIEDLVISKNQPKMNKSQRLEFGIERVFDNRSSVEANVFFDTTFNHGVNISGLSFAPLGGDDSFVADQQGAARGMRVVYTRRVSGPLSASAGFAFGNGQRLSSEGFADPSRIFESDFFQSYFAQLSADLKTGTTVKTIYRLSPQATVFAIDPFKGRLAIYDPGLSVLVTQNLPNLGLPFQAQAIIDARNVFDLQSGITTEEGSLRLNAQRRMLTGGIKVRF